LIGECLGAELEAETATYHAYDIDDEAAVTATVDQAP
jgi:hypothetical protein